MNITTVLPGVTTKIPDEIWGPCSDKAPLFRHLEAGNQSSCYIPVVKSRQRYAVAINGYISPILVVITIITNTLISLVLTKKSMRSPTNTLLVAMAVSDMLTVVFPIPYYIPLYSLREFRGSPFIPYRWCYGYRVLTDYLPTICHTASLWLTVALAVQRYLWICRPTTAKHFFTVQRTCKIVVVIYVLATLSQACRFFENHYHPIPMKLLKPPTSIPSGNFTLFGSENLTDLIVSDVNIIQDPTNQSLTLDLNSNQYTNRANQIAALNMNKNLANDIDSFFSVTNEIKASKANPSLMYTNEFEPYIPNSEFEDINSDLVHNTLVKRDITFSNEKNIDKFNKLILKTSVELNLNLQESFSCNSTRTTSVDCASDGSEFTPTYVPADSPDVQKNEDDGASACIAIPVSVILNNRQLYYNTYYGFRLIFIHLVPCVSLVVLNALLVHAMAVAQTKRARLMKNNRRVESRRLKESNLTTLMLVAVVALFLLVELPLAVMFIFLILSQTFNIEVIPQKTLSDATLFVNLCIMLSYPINFFIYCGMSRQFRDTFTSLFTPCGKKGSGGKMSNTGRTGRGHMEMSTNQTGVQFEEVIAK